VSASNIVSGKRASRNSRIIREIDSDEEEEEEEPEAMDVDEEEEEDEEDEDEEDAEGEDDDGDDDAEGEEDDDMEDVTPAPRIIVSNNDKALKASTTGKPQDTVEAKEMAMDDDDDDEELSELESEEKGEDEDAEGEDEDAEGEDDDELAAQNEDDEDMDSDDASRDQTPDLSKLTRRQRAMHVEDSDGSLLALSNGTAHSLQPIYLLNLMNQQKHRRRNTSLPKSTLCAEQRWRAEEKI
jgi:Ino eighty subunit 2